MSVDPVQAPAASPYKHSARAVTATEDRTLLAKNRGMRDKFLDQHDTYAKQVKHRRVYRPRSADTVNAELKKKGYDNFVTVETKSANKYDEKWLKKNRVELGANDDVDSYERDGWAVKKRGRKTYAYSPDYVLLQKNLRKSAYERQDATVTYHGRMDRLDVPRIKPGFTTAAVHTVQNDDIIQVYKPVTGPNNQYPAWLRRYIDATEPPRDVVFYDIGVLKVPGERRASRVAIYKEGAHFEVFRPALNDRLVRTMATREPVYITEDAAHVAVATYQQMATRARDRLLQRSKSLPRFNENDGGFSQIGYITMHDADDDSLVVKALHGFMKDGHVVPYINVTVAQTSYDAKRKEPRVKRHRKHLVLDNYVGGQFGGRPSFMVVVYDDKFQAVNLDGTASVAQALAGRRLQSFATSVPNKYNDRASSPGRTIDYTQPSKLAECKPIIDVDAIVAKEGAERVNRIIAMETEVTGATPFTHERLVAALQHLHAQNEVAAKKAEHVRFRDTFPSDVKHIDVSVVPQISFESSSVSPSAAGERSSRRRPSADLGGGQFSKESQDAILRAAFGRPRKPKPTGPPPSPPVNENEESDMRGGVINEDDVPVPVS